MEFNMNITWNFVMYLFHWFLFPGYYRKFLFFSGTTTLKEPDVQPPQTETGNDQNGDQHVQPLQTEMGNNQNVQPLQTEKDNDQNGDQNM